MTITATHGLSSLLTASPLRVPSGGEAKESGPDRDGDADDSASRASANPPAPAAARPGAQIGRVNLLA